ncbi:MAG: TolC family protein [Treponema sp.]|nr:TolC family protein [Treponema sp.]
MQKLFFTLIIFCVFLFSLYSNERETLTFSDAAELAVSASAQLRYMHASQILYEGAWKWGLRAYFPRININASENDRLQQIGADSFAKNYSIGVDQLLWDGGRTSTMRRLERLELDISSARLIRSASDIAESAIAAYRNLLSSRTIYEIRNTAITVLEEQRRILNEEVLLGLALPVDLASADISLANAKLEIFSLKLDLEEMEKQFLELLGLETMPVLTERVDVNRSVSLPSAAMAAALAREQNPDLTEARFSITKKQAELKYITNSWIPTLRLNCNFGLNGPRYPLTRYNWSVGITLDFSSPWFQNRIGASTGWEPVSFGRYDRTAMLQNSFTPLPDPAASYGARHARLALELEQENYNIILERIGRLAASAVEKCAFIEQRRVLALEAAALGNERCRIEEIRLGLGHITRLRLMESLIEQTQREVNAIEAATALLEAEHQLEKLLDLPPGGLAELFGL